MQLITDEYRRLNETLHNTNQYYGMSGHKYSDDILNICHNMNTKDVLDYGCGKCTLANTLPFVIKKYDPAIRAFSEDPDEADIVACTDVMEHIEPRLLDDVLTHIRSKTKKMAYFVISTQPAKKILEDGRNAHLIIEGSTFWFNKLSEYFEILNFSKKGSCLAVIAQAVIRQETENKGCKL